MKNKKGFTLIEIIVCIVLITLISTISIVAIKNKKKNYSDITKKILNAANVYISIEKDSQGNSYEYGINNGGKAIQVNVKELLNKGYIDKETYTTLENNFNKENYLIFISNSIKTKDDEECKSSGLNYTVNWENVEETVYLCPYNDTKDNNNDDGTIFNKIINQDAYSDCEVNYNSSDSSSFCVLHGKNISNNENINDIYYYMGTVKNNYIKIDGLEHLFRIYRTTENNDIMVIDNNNADLSGNTVNKVMHSVMNTSGSLIFEYDYSWSGRAYWEGYELFKTGELNYQRVTYNSGRKSKCSDWQKDTLDVRDYSYSGDIQMINCSDNSEYNVNSLTNKYIYNKVHEQREFVDEESYSKYFLNYNWCYEYERIKDNGMSGINFKCKENKLTTNAIKIGFLTSMDYNATGFVNVSDSDKEKFKIFLPNIYSYANGNDEEIIIDLATCITSIYIYKSGFFHNNQQSSYIRPVYVLSGKSIIVSGDGTESNPYVIKGIKN